MRHFRAVWLLSFLSVACIPKEHAASVSDLDGDGIADAFDSCMADAEDFDGFEDEDGCPESGTAADAPASEAPVAAVADPTRKTKKLQTARADFDTNTAKAKIAMYHKGAWGAVLADGEKAAVVFGFNKGWILDGSKTRFTFKQDIYRASFSPDGSRAAVLATSGFEVRGTSTGKLVRGFDFAKGTADSPETKLILFASNDEVRYFDGCQLYRATLSGDASPSAIGAPHCGRPLASRDGQHWFIWQQEDDNVQVYSVDAQSGKESLALGGEGDAPGLSLLVTDPDGRYLCYSRHHDASELTCRDLQSKGPDLVVWEGPSDQRAAFADEDHLVFGGGPRGKSRPLLSLDLGSSSLKRIGELGPKEKWLVPAGNHRVAAGGGSALLVIDVGSKTTTTIALRPGEWEGFAAIPGSNNAFIVGKERRTTRDLFRVTLP